MRKRIARYVMSMTSARHTIILWGNSFAETKKNSPVEGGHEANFVIVQVQEIHLNYVFSAVLPAWFDSCPRCMNSPFGVTLITITWTCCQEYNQCIVPCCRAVGIVSAGLRLNANYVVMDASFASSQLTPNMKSSRYVLTSPPNLKRNQDIIIPG
jgi:hypothetical protein